MAGDLDPFSEACGLRRPIDLRVVRSDEVVVAEGEIDLPCALIGRDPACEITLTDADVSLRHACLQAVGGRVLIADTGSRTGLVVNGTKQSVAWLTPTDPVAIGSLRLTLRRPLLTRPSIPDLNPLVASSGPVPGCPPVLIRFLNGKSANAEWQVNRPVTFLGRARDCKITLAADDIAPYHCYFVLTPVGLWLVDLLTPIGVLVNSEPVRFHLLEQGDRVQVGRFRLGIHYPDRVPSRTPTPTAAAGLPPKPPMRLKPLTVADEPASDVPDLPPLPPLPATMAEQPTRLVPTTPPADLGPLQQAYSLRDRLEEFIELTHAWSRPGVDGAAGELARRRQAMWEALRRQVEELRPASQEASSPVPLSQEERG